MMSETFRITLFVIVSCVMALPLLYVAFRMASAGWHRSKVEIERRYNRGDDNGC